MAPTKFVQDSKKNVVYKSVTQIAFYIRKNQSYISTPIKIQFLSLRIFHHFSVQVSPSKSNFPKPFHRVQSDYRAFFAITPSHS